jgi:hypothetical protein
VTEPKHVVGLSGGKDSSCLALALAEREPRDYEYICTPTGDELPELFDHLTHMEHVLGKPIKRIGIGKTMLELVDEMQMIPNFRQRWCTRILKIEPTIEYMQTLPPGSVLYVGLRADEEEREGIYGEDITSDFPFRRWGWKMEDVVGFLAQRRIAIPKRTDCASCFHQRIVEWFYLWRDHRDLYDKAARKEREIGYSFRSPGRDTWPLFLDELAKDFERGRKIRGKEQFDAEKDRCRVCSL